MPRPDTFHRPRSAAVAPVAAGLLTLSLAALLAVPARAQSIAEILEADTRAATAKEQARAAQEEQKARDAKALASSAASGPSAPARERARRVREFQLVSLYGAEGARIAVVSVDGVSKTLREREGAQPPAAQPVAAARGRAVRRPPAATPPQDLRLAGIDGACVRLAGPADAPGRLCFSTPTAYSVMPAAELARLPSGMPPWPGLPGAGLPSPVSAAMPLATSMATPPATSTSVPPALPAAPAAPAPAAAVKP